MLLLSQNLSSESEDLAQAEQRYLTTHHVVCEVKEIFLEEGKVERCELRATQQPSATPSSTRWTPWFSPFPSLQTLFSDWLIRSHAVFWLVGRRGHLLTKLKGCKANSGRKHADYNWPLACHDLAGETAGNKTTLHFPILNASISPQLTASLQNSRLAKVLSYD